MQYIKKFAKSFFDGFKSSKSEVFHNLLTLIVCLIIFALAVFAIITVGPAIITIIFLLWLFAPGVLEYIVNGLKASQQASCNYPVFFAWRDGQVIGYLMDEIFKDVYSIFQSCYFVGWKEMENCVVYGFKIVFKPDMPLSYQLLILVQNMAEKVLANTLSDYDMSAPCSSMVYADIKNDILIITFAKNEAGITETMKNQERLYRKYHKPEQTKRDNFAETWDDERNN